jgi:hypothetical protein
MAFRHFVVAGALALAGCTSGPTVKTDFDPATNFGGYHSYSWIYTATPQGMNPLLFERVRASINRSFAARGFAQATPGEFAVAFTIGRRDSVQITDFGAYGPSYRPYAWGPGFHDIDVRQITDGTLVIDIYDTATRKPIWHGIATQQVDPNKVDQAVIDTAVDAVLAGFPPQPKTK